MSAKPSSARRTDAHRKLRCRAMLIAPTECDEADRLFEELGPRALLAKNAFSAIGELSFSPAQEPIEIVILAESAVAGVSDHPARALRRVDPAVRLLLVRESNNGSSASELDADAFDEVLTRWPSADAVLEMLRGEAVDSEFRGQKSEVGGQRSEVRGRRSEVRGRKADEGDSPARRPRNTPASEPPERLGDIDLVEAVMSSSQGESNVLREMAIELIKQHTGWSDVTLIERQLDERASPQAASHEAPVKYAGRDIGVLRSRKAPPDQLNRWADWLARWLALDEDHRKWRCLSERDELTGAYNRRYFMAFLAEAIRDAAKRRQPVAVMVFDLDDFKRYNDDFGHAAGDEILRETVRLLNSVIRKSDRVCRIGGDEFAVIFTDPGGPRERGSAPPETAEILAQRFQDQVCKMRFPKLGIEAPGTLSVSAGLATFPWDGWDPDALLNHADALALQSKRKGKNALTLGRGAKKSE